MSKKEESVPTTPKKTKAEDKDKAEAPKASLKKDKKKTTTKPKSKVVKKSTEKKNNKKSVKKSQPSTPKKTTTHKKAAKKDTPKKNDEQNLDAKSDLSGFDRYVFEAISAKATEDKPWVGKNTITGYIRQYIPDVKEGNIAKYTQNALDRLIKNKILKRKKNSFAIAADGKKLNIIIPTKRETIRQPTVKGEKIAMRQEKEERYVQIDTKTGRVSTRVCLV